MLTQWVWEKSDRNERIDSDTLAVIDWPGCLAKCGEDDARARWMMAMLTKDLTETAATLATAYAERDTKALCAALQRCLGGVVHFALPQLEHAIKMFQQAVSTTPQDEGQLTTTYEALQAAITEFKAAAA